MHIRSAPPVRLYPLHARPVPPPPSPRPEIDVWFQTDRRARNRSSSLEPSTIVKNIYIYE